jgi:hypothetical protein
MIKMIAYQSKVVDGKVLVDDSEGRSIHSNNANELLQFLITDYSDKANKVWDVKVAFDLDVFITPILRILGVDACRALSSPEHTHNGIFYIPSKILRLEIGGHKSYFYHLQQYYPDYLNDTLQGTVRKTQAILDALREINMSSLSLTSPIAIYEKQMLDKLNVPTIIDVPNGCEESIIYAEECCRSSSEWVESFQLGHWNAGEVFQYDISSAFPFYPNYMTSVILL